MYTAVILVGPTGLEPATSWSRTKRSSHLSYGPIKVAEIYYIFLTPPSPEVYPGFRHGTQTKGGRAVLKRKSLWIATILVMASLVGIWCARRDPTEVVVTIALERAPVLHLVPGQKFETVSVDPQGRIWVISRPMEPDEEADEPRLIDLPPAKDGTVRHLIILEYPREAPEQLLPAKGI